MRVPLTSLVLTVAGCAVPSGPMTTAEALAALEQARTSDDYEATTTEPIELSTDFTIGDAVIDAAEELAAFWEAQAPCTTVRVTGATTTIDYGGLDDPCTYDGRTFAGVHRFTVVAAAGPALEVDHAFEGFTDGMFTVDGTADVTWDAGASTRRVVTDVTWSRDDGVTTDVTGDHVYGLLQPALGAWLGGVTLDGTRAWTNDAGRWDLEMADVEARFVDPAPQAGTFTLTNPDGKVLVLAFQRLDALTIRVTLTGTARPIVVDVTPLGASIEE